MTSPFPGMDPYLERPSLWPDVHLNLICNIRASLNRQLRPNYVGRISHREYAENKLTISEPRIEIFATDDQRRVVTVIEILSPANKASGSGRDSFQAKRREVLSSAAHWVEIDLLRAGERAEFRHPLEPHEYCVLVSQADIRPEVQVWPFRLHEPMPVIPVPLHTPDPGVPIDLGQALADAYDRGAYDMTVNYRDAATPPLPPNLAAWADALLRERGLR